MKTTRNDIALLVIDMQKGFFQAEPLKSRREAVVNACNELIQAAVAGGRDVFLIRTQHADRSTWTLNMREDGKEFLMAGSSEAAFLPELADAGEEVTKTRDSAFFRTGLAEMLRGRGISRLVLCGVSTHSCVAQTAQDAYAENFEVALAADAIAAHDEAYHSPILKMLEQEYRQRGIGQAEAIKLLKTE